MKFFQQKKRNTDTIFLSPLCKHCGQLETQLHKISSCRNDPFWKWTCRILQKLVPQAHVGQIKEMITKIKIHPAGNTFLQTWIVMGYLYYVIDGEDHTINGYRNLLRKAATELQRKISKVLFSQLTRANAVIIIFKKKRKKKKRFICESSCTTSQT